MSKRGKAAKLLPLHDDDLNAAIARDEAELAAILDPSKLEKILNMDFEADDLGDFDEAWDSGEGGDDLDLFAEISDEEFLADFQQLAAEERAQERALVRAHEEHQREQAEAEAVAGGGGGGGEGEGEGEGEAAPAFGAATPSLGAAAAAPPRREKSREEHVTELRAKAAEAHREAKELLKQQRREEAKAKLLTYKQLTRQADQLARDTAPPPPSAKAQAPEPKPQPVAMSVADKKKAVKARLLQYLRMAKQYKDQDNPQAASILIIHTREMKQLLADLDTDKAARLDVNEMLPPPIQYGDVPKPRRQTSLTRMTRQHSLKTIERQESLKRAKSNEQEEAAKVGGEDAEALTWEAPAELVEAVEAVGSGNPGQAPAPEQQGGDGDGEVGDDVSAGEDDEYEMVEVDADEDEEAEEEEEEDEDDDGAPEVSQSATLSVKQDLAYEAINALFEKQFEELTMLAKDALKRGDKRKARAFLETKKEETKAQRLLEAAQKKGYPPPEYRVLDIPVEREMRFDHLGTNEIELTVLSAEGLEAKGGVPKAYVMWSFEQVEAKPQSGTTQCVKANDPVFHEDGEDSSDAKFVLEFQSKYRKSRFHKRFKHLKIQFQVYHSRPLWKDILLGECTLKLEELLRLSETQVTIQLRKKGTRRNGKLTVRARIQTPITGPDVREGKRSKVALKFTELTPSSNSAAPKKKVVKVKKKRGSKSQSQSQPRSKSQSQPRPQSKSQSQQRAAPSQPAPATPAPVEGPPPGIEANEWADPVAPHFIVSSDVFDWEKTYTAKELAQAKQRKDQDAVYALEDRLQQINLHDQILLAMVQEERVSFEEYIERLQQRLPVVFRLAQYVKRSEDEEFRKHAGRLGKHVALMREELQNADQPVPPLKAEIVEEAAPAPAPAPAPAAPEAYERPPAPDGVDPNEWADPVAPHFIVSSDVFDWEKTYTAKELAQAKQRKDQEAVYDLEDRLQAIELQERILVATVQEGKITLEEYLERLRERIPALVRLVKHLKDLPQGEGREHVTRLVQHAKLMKSELATAEANAGELGE